MNGPDVPLRYRTGDPLELAQDLGRLATSLVTWARGLPSSRDTLPEVGGLTDSPVLAFGQATRVSPRDGQWVTLQLPKPSPGNGGRSLSVVRLSTLGAVELVTTGCLVNGLPRILLLGQIGTTTIFHDGANYYMDNGGALNWGYGLL